MSNEILLLDKKTQTIINDYLPPKDVLYNMADFFSVFADYTRLKIISALAISEMCVNDLSLILNINQTTISHQLRLLKNLGAVLARREGKIVFYSLKSELLTEVFLKGIEFLTL